MPSKAESLFISSPELAQMFGVALGTIKRWSRNGDMPQGRRVGPRLLKWGRQEITDRVEPCCPPVDTHRQQVFH